MTNWKKLRRPVAGALAAGMALLLAACMLMPGTFDSTLHLRRDGTFTFTYTGDVYLLGLSQMAEMADEADGSAEFTPHCYDEETFEDRDCTEEETEQQRSEWETRQADSDAEAEMGIAAMSAMMGGVNLDDPDAGSEIAARLRRQAGWKSVEYAGDGLFKVDFAITSTITHDFVFPTFEDMQMADKFLMVTRRANDTVRINAPGFVSEKGTSMSGMMVAMAEKESDTDLNLPEIDGTFRVITDGTILANNTDEGPQAAPEKDDGQMLQWTLTPRSRTAPTALIQLEP
ncbi:hypothetical protein D6851_09780 [Altericroceibacterium spongiae]|uniref:Uncharacterized protein n=1 Tax=Altericroceibacterium spongiae TaxID=2320269 RepID=A0A420EKL0_9SPHN|nr:hypothetical protein [Altericroceibacterium spongiae]RKF21190.1 hypothetical protein D6851_09780 [Altericroceibacterium spongiae]